MFVACDCLPVYLCGFRGVVNLITAANSSCVNGEIRLVNGSGVHSGRVEVCFNDQFGTVCDDNWGSDDATVVCNQLGYRGQGRAHCIYTCMSNLTAVSLIMANINYNC